MRSAAAQDPVTQDGGILSARDPQSQGWAVCRAPDPPCTPLIISFCPTPTLWPFWLGVGVNGTAASPEHGLSPWTGLSCLLQPG